MLAGGTALVGAGYDLINLILGRFYCIIILRVEFRDSGGSGCRQKVVVGCSSWNDIMISFDDTTMATGKRRRRRSECSSYCDGDDGDR